MEVYLIRHGQSTNNALMEDQHLREYDPPLTEVGHRQAELVAAFLKEHANLEEIVRHKVEERDSTVSINSRISSVVLCCGRSRRHAPSRSHSV